MRNGQHYRASPPPFVETSSDLQAWVASRHYPSSATIRTRDGLAFATMAPWTARSAGPPSPAQLAAPNCRRPVFSESKDRLHSPGSKLPGQQRQQAARSPRHPHRIAGSIPIPRAVTHFGRQADSVFASRRARRAGRPVCASRIHQFRRAGPLRFPLDQKRWTERDGHHAREPSRHQHQRSPREHARAAQQRPK